MDLSKRLDQMDEELKLLKNEIKQVLLEIQEHVLTVQNPFVGLTANVGPVGTEESNDIVSRRLELLENKAEQAPAPGGSDENRGAQSPGGGPSPQASGSGDLCPGGRGGSIPETGMPSHPTAPDSADFEGPEDASMPARHDGTRKTESADADDGSGKPRYTPGERLRRKNGLDSVRKREESRKKSYVDESEKEQVEEDEREEDEGGEAAASNRKGPASPSLDLLTIAGLASWTDQVIRKVGREQLDALLRISEIRGHLSKETKETILSLALLLDGGREGYGGVTAKEMVALLAQLDAVQGNGTKDDANILPLLLYGNMGGLPSIRR